MDEFFALLVHTILLLIPYIVGIFLILEEGLSCISQNSFNSGYC